MPPQLPLNDTGREDVAVLQCSRGVISGADFTGQGGFGTAHLVRYTQLHRQNGRLLLRQGHAEAAEELYRMALGIAAGVEHLFRIVKRQFGYTKVRYRGLTKNTAQVMVLIGLANLYALRRRLVTA